jgi:hypothetical protein
MHLIFKHGEHSIYGAEIEPIEDSALPQIVMIGAALFHFHEMIYDHRKGYWEAHYQVARPMIMPPVASVHDYITSMNS